MGRACLGVCTKWMALCVVYDSLVMEGCGGTQVKIIKSAPK